MPSTSPRRRIIALLLALVPGWGHVYWRRERFGLTVFTAAAVAGFAWLNGLFVYRGSGRLALVWCSGIAYLAVAAAAWVELFRRTRPERVEADEEERAVLLRRGTAAYVRGDHATALESFQQCLRFAPQDVEALFRLGVVAARTGDARQARRWFRRTKRYDVEDKWRWEIARELGRLKGRAQPSAASREKSAVMRTERQEEAEPASA